jgi:V8-like Glu-specific endopeptidase
LIISTYEATPNSVARRHRATALLAALAMFAALVFAAAATAAGPQPRAASGVSPAAGVAKGDDPSAGASVIGGHNATIQQYPSLAFIEGAVATAGYACTGTVVAPRVVLTAGHCVEDLESSSITQPEQIAVATGISNLQHIPDAKISRVEKVLANPDFNPSKLQGDAGLLILKTPVSAPAIALAGPEDAALYEAGDQVTIAGWGIDDRATEHAPNQLQAGTVPVAEAKRCKEGTRRFYPFFDAGHQVCTLDVPHFDTTTCHGDSGGPAIATGPDGSPVEIGITSLGDGTCNPTSPAVFTRVDQIQPWVQSWIDATEAGGPQPRIRIPKAHIPDLSRERAEELSAFAMEEAFAAKFVNGQEHTISCQRLAKARAKCGVTWFQGPNDYFGSVTTFYALRHNVVLAGVHYNVNWVNDYCYFHSGHRQTCRVQTKHK